MHVGLVVYDGLAETSGGYRYDRQLVAHCRERGDEVSVLALPRRRYPLRLADAASRRFRARLNQPVDVLVVDELCHASVWLHVQHLDRPGAVVAIVHHLRSAVTAVRFARAIRTIESRFLRSVDGAICVSEDTRNRVLAHGGRPTVVAPPGGRHCSRTLTPRRVVERSRRDPLRILFVGSVVPRKGLPTLVEALARLDGEWRLDVVGSLQTDFAHGRTVGRTVSRLGLDDHVSFRGAVSDGTLCKLYERSHILAVPSRFEGFGMVYLEAMEYGIVPIASSRGGASDIVSDGTNGFLVEPDDPGSVASVLESVIDDRRRLASMGTRALETADSHPTWDTSMDAARSFCAALAGASQPPGRQRSNRSVDGGDRR